MWISSTGMVTGFEREGSNETYGDWFIIGVIADALDGSKKTISISAVGGLIPALKQFKAGDRVHFEGALTSNFRRTSRGWSEFITVQLKRDFDIQYEDP